MDENSNERKINDLSMFVFHQIFLSDQIRNRGMPQAKTPAWHTLEIGTQSATRPSTKKVLKVLTTKPNTRYTIYICHLYFTSMNNITILLLTNT